ncbi:unnamed protein product [Arabidopsis halleri]
MIRRQICCIMRFIAFIMLSFFLRHFVFISHLLLNVFCGDAIVISILCSYVYTSSGSKQ